MRCLCEEKSVYFNKDILEQEERKFDPKNVHINYFLVILKIRV
jgi:hypothetical protein